MIVGRDGGFGGHLSDGGFHMKQYCIHCLLRLYCSNNEGRYDIIDPLHPVYQ